MFLKGIKSVSLMVIIYFGTYELLERTGLGAEMVYSYYRVANGDSLEWKGKHYRLLDRFFYRESETGSVIHHIDEVADKNGGVLFLSDNQSIDEIVSQLLEECESGERKNCSPLWLDSYTGNDCFRMHFQRPDGVGKVEQHCGLAGSKALVSYIGRFDGVGAYTSQFDYLVSELKL